ncbi:hypothetical protein R3P38DRAFT_2808390 [Favolaschia claudopus]|uniref:Uncharacterized protein n=1 Tax=Favolaschia claudopus TaxID=2862362 RepID=A0AAV9ZGG1_9AGAR
MVDARAEPARKGVPTQRHNKRRYTAAHETPRGLAVPPPPIAAVAASAAGEACASARRGAACGRRSPFAAIRHYGEWEAIRAIEGPQRRCFDAGVIAGRGTCEERSVSSVKRSTKPLGRDERSNEVRRPVPNRAFQRNNGVKTPARKGPCQVLMACPLEVRSSGALGGDIGIGKCDDRRICRLMEGIVAGAQHSEQRGRGSCGEERRERKQEKAKKTMRWQIPTSPGCIRVARVYRYDHRYSTLLSR